MVVRPQSHFHYRIVPKMLLHSAIFFIFIHCVLTILIMDRYVNAIDFLRLSEFLSCFKEFYSTACFVYFIYDVVNILSLIVFSLFLMLRIILFLMFFSIDQMGNAMPKSLRGLINKNIMTIYEHTVILEKRLPKAKQNARICNVKTSAGE